MTKPLFDDAARARNMARAAAGGFAGFLVEQVVDEIQERLKEVNRPFTDRAIVADLEAPWAGLGPVVPAAETLALEPARHDLVVHGLSLHAANDPVGQLIQIRHALRPDGMALAALFGGESLRELREVLTAAEAELAGGLRPRAAPMGEIRDWGGLLQRAGLALPVADSMALTITYADIWALMRDLRAMGECNTLAARHRGFTRRALFERAAEMYQTRFAGADGRLVASVEVIFLTGWAPAAGQQQPLKPGSAQMRLADALGKDKKPD